MFVFHDNFYILETKGTSHCLTRSPFRIQNFLNHNFNISIELAFVRAEAHY